jgi:ribosomal protein S27AE
MGIFDCFKSLAEEMDEMLTVLDKHDKWTWTITESDTSKCPKCGSSGINIMYDKKTDQLAKKCGRCNYDWLEDPLDKKKK